jgi:hypothetical protein
MALTLGEAARRTGRAKSSLRRALNLGKIKGSKTSAGEWEVDEASLFVAYPPPGDGTGGRPGSRPESGAGNDQLVAALRDSLDREREINRKLHAELERERDARERDRSLFRDLAEQWKRSLPAPDAQAPQRPWWRFWR